MKATVHLEVDARLFPDDDRDLLRQQVARAYGLKTGDVLSLSIVKRSLDARRKPKVKLLYALTVEFRDGARPQGRLEPPTEIPQLPVPENRAGLQQPVVVGTGPAGLFGALLLAMAGTRPIVVERGCDVTRRGQDIRQFFATRQLNPESNLLFGEGGAGTWSDGKLFTRVRDPRARFVLETFVNAGAQPEILYYAHPHIGSDRLPEVIAAIRRRICELGGTFQWDTRVTAVEAQQGRFQALRLHDGSRLTAPAALVACGHSARDLIEQMATCTQVALKGFQIGCRIEHPQAFINRNQFGVEKPCPALGAAEYLFSIHGDERGQGASTFCMCPGGEIIPATCEPNTLCTNGMSNAARDGLFANSAIISTLHEGTFSTPREAFAFLHQLEARLFACGGSDYTAPAQTAAAFLRHTTAPLPKQTSYQLGLTPARLDQLVPQPVQDAIRRALHDFDRKAPGFIQNGTLIGMETRVSSPVRFLRHPDNLASSLPGLYIAGEGGGMAGGIVSAAIDGIRLAEKMLAGR